MKNILLIDSNSSMVLERILYDSDTELIDLLGSIASKYLLDSNHFSNVDNLNVPTLNFLFKLKGINLEVVIIPTEISELDTVACISNNEYHLFTDHQLEDMPKIIEMLAPMVDRNLIYLLKSESLFDKLEILRKLSNTKVIIL